MARVTTLHSCADCGTTTPTWLGRCPGCGAWNTLVEERTVAARPGRKGAAHVPAAPTSAQPIGEVDLAAWQPRPTGLGEVDRVLGGGLVPGSVTLLGGEPGAGKSTLLLQALAAMARTGAPALLVTAEESAQQVRLRADRIGAVVPGLHLAADTVLPDVLRHLDQLRPQVMVVDSIQTVFDPELGSAPGSVTQVRECAHRLTLEAKRTGTAVALVGHVTKDGALAGPRVLEHIVDTVLSLEGDRHNALRLLRAVKHRFGATLELGVFEVTEQGLDGVPDASGLFLADRHTGVPGSVVVPALDGHRPLLVELQSLVSPSKLPQPRRSAQGVDPGRLSLLLAVLQRRMELPVAECDVFASAVGGVKVVEPAADLPLALAVVSSLAGVPLPDDMVACGEIGLGGEVRQVANTGRRLAEAARLGFARALVPVASPDPPAGVEVVRVGSVAEALLWALDGRPVS
jgi:DNA repair protein RadA/Sms